MAQLRANNEFYETHGLVTSDGAPVTAQNPLPVSLGSENITITGSVNVGSSVTVISSPEDPVHVHVTEIPEVEIKNDTGNPIPVEWVYGDGATLIPWEMQVARGVIPNVSVVTRSGYLPDASQNVETSIWVEGGIYPHGTWTTPGKLYVICTNAGDSGKKVFIEGLDSNYDYYSEEVTLAGLTAVATTGNFIRIWTATVTSASNNSANAGEITFRLTSGTGTVVAHIGAGLGITKLSQFTVPRGYSAYVQYGDCTSYHSGAGNVGTLLKMMVRPFGGSFFAGFVAEVAAGNPYRNEFKIPMRLPAKSDVDVRVTADTSNTKITCNWQIVLYPD